VLTAEYAQLMDDYFRWYVGHRVYHEGFTQDGRALGAPAGGDSETAWGQLSYWGSSYRIRLQAEWVHRVGVVESRGENVFTLRSDEHQLAGSLFGDINWRRAWWTAGYEFRQTTNRDFVEGNDHLEHRVVVSVTVGPEFGR
jgi:hypothetical protein